MSDDPPDGFMTRAECVRVMSVQADQLKSMDSKLDTILEFKTRIVKLEDKDGQRDKEKQEKKQTKKEKRERLSGWMLVLFGIVMGFIFEVLAKFIHV